MRTFIEKKKYSSLLTSTSTWFLTSRISFPVFLIFQIDFKVDSIHFAGYMTTISMRLSPFGFHSLSGFFVLFCLLFKCDNWHFLAVLVSFFSPIHFFAPSPSSSSSTISSVFKRKEKHSKTIGKRERSSQKTQCRFDIMRMEAFKKVREKDWSVRARRGLFIPSPGLKGFSLQFHIVSVNSIQLNLKFID